VAVAASLTVAERDALEQLLRGVFGTAARLVVCHVTVRRHDYLVVLATLNLLAREIAIKLAGPDAPLACPFDRTATILRRVRAQTMLPVPEPLAHDCSAAAVPWRWSITTRLPGHRWSDVRRGWSASEHADAWAALGRAVAALHSLTFAAYGEIDATGAVSIGRPYAAALATRAALRIADRDHRARFVDLLAERADLFAARRAPSLSHDDLNPTNLLLLPDPHTERWELSGLLDFDSAWAGDRESDLARLALWDGMIGGPFWAAYGREGTLAPDEAERRLILQLLWCLEYAQPTARHHADTARICAALGLPTFTFG
jgi:aminoglycoside phosphotransferase (APT) family kinase protein